MEARIGRPHWKYYLSDSSQKRISALQERISRLGTEHNCEICVADFSETVRKLFSGEHTKSWWDAGYLVFLDPFGLQVDWGSMEKILTSRAVDMLFSFMSGAVVRNKNKKLSEQKINNYFGDENWKGLNTHEEFLNYYRSKIENIGYDREYKTFEIDVAHYQGQRYYLIFASRNDKATKIFDYIKKRVSSINNQMLQNAFGVGVGSDMDLDAFQNQV